MDACCLLAAAVFFAHVIGNLTLSRSGSRVRIDKLSLFPPAWVFVIWLVIWTLQVVLLFRTYGTGLWTWPVTAFFILTCIGNLGSQIAGARNWGAVCYLAFLCVMFVSAVAFWLIGASNKGHNDFLFQATAQLYVGWAAIAGVIGTGVVLVCDWQVVADESFSRVGLAILLAVPPLVWSVWGIGVADARVVSAPFLWVLFALATRTLSR